MKIQNLFLVLLVGVVGCALAAPRPNPAWDWNQMERKFDEWALKLKEMKDKALLASQSICNSINKWNSAQLNPFPSYTARGYYPAPQPIPSPFRPSRPVNSHPRIPMTPNSFNPSLEPDSPKPKEENNNKPILPPAYIPPTNEEEEALPDFALEQDDLLNELNRT